MAKKAANEKELLEHLKAEGLREVKISEKSAKWYKKASERPSCLRATKKDKSKELV
jgi:hypothetical protein